jgi:hypothetical protein
VACSDVFSIICNIKSLVDELKFSIKGVRLHQDNQSTIKLIKNNKPTSQRTKHIDIRYFFMRNRAEMGDIDLVYTATKEMVADVPTKPLQGHQFNELRSKLLNS